MKKILLFTLALLITACGLVAQDVQGDPSPESPIGGGEEIMPTLDGAPTAEPAPTATPEPDVEKYNFLLLGGDYRYHRRGTRYGDKTDVMLLAQITMTDPIQIRVVQFPRNFYFYFGPETVAFPDMWLFHVYGRSGFEGLEYYFDRVFGVELDAIAYIHMDNFIAFVDSLGPIQFNYYNADGKVVGGQINDEPAGEAVLAWLRDNDNNWGCPYYDCQSRQFIALRALAERVKTKFRESPIATAQLFWNEWSGLFKTDLSGFDSFVALMEIGWKVAESNYEITSDKLTQSGFIEYGDTPLEVRGWIVTDPDGLKDFFK